MVLNKKLLIVSDCESNFTTYNHFEHGTITAATIVRIIVPCSEPTIILNI